MSGVTERFLSCDYGISQKCRGEYGVDCRHESFKNHRKGAKNEGWKVIGKKDICPECLKELKKGESNG